MNAFAWNDPSFSLRFVMALLHFLWQGCVVGAFVIAGGAMLRRAPAQWRYVLNVAALLLMAACLPVTFALLDIAQDAPAAVAQRRADSQPVMTGEWLDAGPNGETTSGTESDADVDSGGSATVPQSIARASDETAVEIGLEAPLRSAASVFLDVARPIAPYFTAVYFACVALMLGQLGTGVWGGHRLRQAAIAVDDETLLALVGRQAKRIGLRLAPMIAWCERISIPVVIGIVKPMILLPAALASGLSPDQLQALITHELAHIRRYDLLVNLLQRLIEAVLFFHPAVWFVSRRVSVERENACDDLVLAAGWQRANYADALVRMAELSSALRNSRIANQAAALAASGANASDFKRRVLRLLENSDTPRLRLTRSGILALALVAASLLVTPLILQSWADNEVVQNSKLPETQTENALDDGIGVAEDPGSSLRSTAGTPHDADDADTRRAVEQAVAFLKLGQRADGSWPENPSYAGGISALATYALLRAGVKPGDESMSRALNYVRTIKPGNTYVTALQTMVLCAAEPKKDEELIRRNVGWLEAKQVKNRPARGGWSYGTDPPGRADGSNSRFALLALHAAQQAGIAAREETWRLARDYWQAGQNADGSWGYQPSSPRGTGSMTCAGVASLAIVSRHLRDGADWAIVRDAAVERALDWLARNFSVAENPGNGDSWLLYYLHSLERAGTLADARFIGQHDWYADGAHQLLMLREPVRGNWSGDGAESDGYIATSFAVLFLMRDGTEGALRAVKPDSPASTPPRASPVDKKTSYKATDESLPKRERQQPDEKLVRHWIEKLRDQDPQVRRDAARSLGDLRPKAEPAIAALVKTLADEGALVGREARLSLAKIGAPAVPVLIAALKHEKKEVRWWAAQALEEIGPQAQSAIPALIASLHAAERPVENAPEALAGIGPASIPSLLEVLQDPSRIPAARAGAARGLGAMGPGASTAVPHLIEALKDRRQPTRTADGAVFYPVCFAAAGALGQIGPDAKAAVPVLAELLSDDNAWVRKTAAESLGEIGPDALGAVPSLVTALRDGDEEVPVRAAIALGNIGPAARDAVPGLIALLARLDGDVNGARRTIVVKALAGIGSDAAPTLVDAYRVADANLAPRVIAALGAIGPKAEQVLPTLIAALADAEDAVRSAALEALGSIGSKAKPAVPAIMNLLKDDDAEIRRHAAFAVFGIGPAAYEAVPDLVEALADRDESVRKEVAWALFAIGPQAKAAASALKQATRDRDREVRAVAAMAIKKVQSDPADTDAADRWRERIESRIP